VTLGASLIAYATHDSRKAFLASLTDEELRGLPYMFDFWALPHQVPPLGDWKSWVVLGGRGAGKTRAGAEWVRAEVEGPGPTDPGRAKRVALVGETYSQAREVMVLGESGILACSPPDRMPKWYSERRVLVWPNGAEAQVFSASDYEALRGPQFDAAWVDELAKWRKAEDAWDMLQFALRLGEHPRQVVTTTPRDVPVLKRILAANSTVQTHAPTRANRANLATSFLEEVEHQFAGTRLGQQELDGVLTEEIEGALWPKQLIEFAQATPVPEVDRIVVAVDPPVTSKKTSDACGIIVAGVKFAAAKKDWRVKVLDDVSVAGASPSEWASVAVQAYHRHGADRIVAEVNQGGDLVEEVVRQIDETVAFSPVHARRGKVIRAEPVAALYEQGRVAHVKGLNALEDQMGLMARRGFEGRGSPDRVDALVWALTELIIKPVAQPMPQVRSFAR